MPETMEWFFLASARTPRTKFKGQLLWESIILALRGKRSTCWMLLLETSRINSESFTVDPMPSTSSNLCTGGRWPNISIIFSNINNCIIVVIYTDGLFSCVINGRKMEGGPLPGWRATVYKHDTEQCLSRSWSFPHAFWSPPAHKRQYTSTTRANRGEPRNQRKNLHRIYYIVHAGRPSSAMPKPNFCVHQPADVPSH